VAGWTAIIRMCRGGSVKDRRFQVERCDSKGAGWGTAWKLVKSASFFCRCCCGVC